MLFVFYTTLCPHLIFNLSVFFPSSRFNFYLLIIIQGYSRFLSSIDCNGNLLLKEEKIR